MQRIPTRRVLLAGMFIVPVAACTAPDRQSHSRADSAAAPEIPLPQVAAPPAGSTAYRALGTEPFWGLDITAAGFRFTTPDDPEGMRFAPAEAVRTGDTLRWTSDAGGTSLDARVWPGECSDNMSDKVWTHTSRVQVGPTTYQGCAEVQPSADSIGG